MRLIFSFILLFGVFCLGTAHSSQPTISSYLIQTESEKKLNEIAKYFEISKRHTGSYEVIVPQPKIAQFLKISPSAKLLNPDISAAVRQVYQYSKQSPLIAAGYHSFNDIVALLNSIAIEKGAIAQLIQYGTSQLGKPLLALRVSNHLNDGKNLPRVMLTAATHGDEIITTEVLINLMSQYLSLSQTQPRFQKYLENLELVFIPVINPDGFSEQNRYDNGEDPNRSYPFPENVNGSPTKSITGIINFTKKYPIIGSIDFHAFGRLIMYPWGYTRNTLPPEIEGVFHNITSKMASTNSYTNGEISRVIYVAKGSSADFYFWNYNSVSLGIEIGDSKSPNPTQIEKYTKEQTESTWIFLDSFLSKK